MYDILRLPVLLLALQLLFIFCVEPSCGSGATAFSAPTLGIELFEGRVRGEYPSHVDARSLRSLVNDADNITRAAIPSPRGEAVEWEGADGGVSHDKGSLSEQPLNQVVEEMESDVSRTAGKYEAHGKGYKAKQGTQRPRKPRQAPPQKAKHRGQHEHKMQSKGGASGYKHGKKQPSGGAPAYKHGTKQPSGTGKEKEEAKRPKATKAPKRFGPRATMRPRATLAPKATAGAGKKGCRVVRKRCGTKCAGAGRKRGKCVVMVDVPKLCEKDVVKTGLCFGGKPKMCEYEEEEPALCTSKKKEMVQCPPEKYRCDKEVLQRKRCEPDGCEKWRKKKCAKPGASKTVPCTRPTRTCNDCRRGYVLGKCKHVKHTRVQVPCSGPASPSSSPASTNSPRSQTSKPHPRPYSPRAWRPAPSPSSSLRPAPNAPYVYTPRSWHAKPSPSRSPSQSPSPSHSPCVSGHASFDPYASSSSTQMSAPNFPEAGSSVDAIRCAGSDFASGQCKKGAPECRLGSRKFSKDRCMRRACSQCAKHKRRGSVRLRSWCREFRENHCGAMYVRTLSDALVGGVEQLRSWQGGVEDIATARWKTAAPNLSKKCFKEVAKTVYRSCRSKLPENEMCVRGCRVKRCPPPVQYCKDRLPPHCPKHQKKFCEFKKKVSSTCVRPGGKNCEGEVTTSFVCNKKKKVKRPCKQASCQGALDCAVDKLRKKCNQVVKEKYVCGGTKEKRVTTCSQNGSSSCKAVYCNVKVCK
eukprot:GFKZ01006898.1.p1 GENE.GFKZ01006898.1~~GFKZ01006898.1.p1  ORF type:complete len:749 (+),score=50.72 GFKZ01006898.1:376-2622(+)